MKVLMRFCTVVSAIVFLISASLFATSWYWRPHPSIDFRADDTITLDSFVGRVTLARVTWGAPPTGAAKDESTSNENIEIGALPAPPPFEWARFDYRSDQLTTSREVLTIWYITIPYWFILLLSAPLPLIAIVRRQLQRADTQRA